jgi:pimeloyl-ACP methyl ester carboxylesterase
LPPPLRYPSLIAAVSSPSARAGFSEALVNVHGLDLVVREQGEGFPLLVVNGLGGSVELLAPAQTSLARGARTVTFDAPGSGRSQTPWWPLGVTGMAEVAVGLMDELGYAEFDLVGYSLGGLVAQQLCHVHPDRVCRLALVATGVGIGTTPGRLQDLALLAFPYRYRSRLLYSLTDQLRSEPDRSVSARLAATRLSNPPSLLGYQQQLFAALTWSSLPWVGEITQSALVVSGTQDTLVPPANSARLARLLKSARLELLEGEGHLLLMDGDSRVHPLLADFFAAA